jgi:hypothetical protein
MVCNIGPACELLPTWMKELYLCTVAPLLYLLTRFGTYKIASPPQTKMTSKDDIKGLVSLKFLRPWGVWTTGGRQVQQGQSGCVQNRGSSSTTVSMGVCTTRGVQYNRVSRGVHNRGSSSATGSVWV